MQSSTNTYILASGVGYSTQDTLGTSSAHMFSSIPPTEELGLRLRLFNEADDISLLTFRPSESRPLISGTFPLIRRPLAFLLEYK